MLRDRVLFETAYVCGARASEVCGMFVEDLDLRPDDEHARVHGEGGTVRAVLLDDRGYAALLRLYMARAGIRLRAAVPRVHQRPQQPAVRRGAPRWKKLCAATGAGSASTSSTTRMPAS